jgi:hypothetical protein
MLLNAHATNLSAALMLLYNTQSILACSRHQIL